MRDVLQLWPIFYAADKQSSVAILADKRISRVKSNIEQGQPATGWRNCRSRMTPAARVHNAESPRSAL
jgi:hypothetical protein